MEKHFSQSSKLVVTNGNKQNHYERMSGFCSQKNKMLDTTVMESTRK